MSWMAKLNPFHYLAGRIFLWFWLVLLSAVFATLSLSQAMTEKTEIRRLPPHIIKQLGQQIIPFATSKSSRELLNRIHQNQPERWLVVNTQTNTVLTPELLPRGFDHNWLTELSQLSRPRWLNHNDISLVGPFVMQIGNDTLALYQKRQRYPQPRWRLQEMSKPVLLGFTILISAVASFILAISISRPLRELLQRNLEFADGLLNSRVTNLIKRKDELGRLGHSFNTMAERISALLTNQQRLLRDISHELRSPLARAQLALGLTERQQNLEQIPRIKQELERLDAMLNELLTFSKLDAGQYQLDRQLFDLTELISEVISVNQVEADAKQQRVSLLSPGPLLLNADSHLLGRAIENVLRNAIKYSAANSEIHCQLQLRLPWLELRICDQGPGIATQELDAIFEPFYRISDSRSADSGGTGLGLAIVAQIVRQHGGEVQASNIAAGGLCITLRLPVN
jgi:two-component system, OmpR family, sensor histidine kinase CpxA